MEFEVVLKEMYSKLKITHDFLLAPVDTDSISFCKKDGASFTEEEQDYLLNEINSMLPEYIVYADDGYFDRICVLKAKNYILKQGDKVKLKGSSLKSSKIEPRLKDFMGDIINALLEDRQHTVLDIYHTYVREVFNLKDISPWASKKTVTSSVLNPTRTNEQKILDALKGRSVQMGDKIYVYFAEEITTTQVPRYKTDRKTKEKSIIAYVEKKVVSNPLRLKEDWNGDHSVDTLLDKLYNTIIIFENVLNIDQFPNYALKGNKEKLKGILNDTNPVA